MAYAERLGDTQHLEVKKSTLGSYPSSEVVTDGCYTRNPAALVIRQLP
jgi:hypothetical protein